MKTIDDNDECLEKESWLATYADAATLLMVLLIMMLSFADYDIPALEITAEAIANEFGGGPYGKKAIMAPTNMLRLDLHDKVFDLQADRVIKVTADGKGVVMELDSYAFFDEGSANLYKEAYPALQQLAAILKQPKYRAYSITVEGHTDDEHIGTLRYPTSWELSTGRAASIVRFFIERKIKPSRLSAIGFAETRPKLPNRDLDGKSIPANQAKNHRMLIRIQAEREKLLVESN